MTLCLHVIVRLLSNLSHLLKLKTEFQIFLSKESSDSFSLHNSSSLELTKGLEQHCALKITEMSGSGDS